MCLSALRREFKGRGTRIKVGYKWFEKGDQRGRYRSPCMGFDYFSNEWHTSSDGIVEEGEGWPTYEKGFHIFTDKKQARKHWLATERNVVLVEVEYRRVVAVGTEVQDRFHNNAVIDVVVAKEMRIKKRVR